MTCNCVFFPSLSPPTTLHLAVVQPAEAQPVPRCVVFAQLMTVNLVLCLSALT